MVNKNATISESKRVKIPQQKWYYFWKGSKFLNKNYTIAVRKGSKILNKNGTILEKGQKSSTKMVLFQAEKDQNSSKNGTISEKGQKSSTKMVPFQKRVKIPLKNGTISEKGQKSSRKMVPFQKRVKNPRQKWYLPFQSEKGHNSSTKKVQFQKKVKIPQQKWYHFRKWSKFLNKNGNRRGLKIVNKNGTVLESGERPIKLFSPLKSPKIKPTSDDFSIFISTQVAPHTSNAPVSPILVHGVGILLAWYLLLYWRDTGVTTARYWLLTL